MSAAEFEAKHRRFTNNGGALDGELGQRLAGRHRAVGCVRALHERHQDLAARAKAVWEHHLHRRLSKWFYDTSTGTAPREQPAVVLLLEGGLVSWSLAMDKRGGHEDLRGSGRRSIILYVHG
jgi:hypothetical protein